MIRRLGEYFSLLAILCNLPAVHDDIELIDLQLLLKLCIVGFDLFGFDVHQLRDGVCDLHLKTNQRLRIVGVLEDIGRATL